MWFDDNIRQRSIHNNIIPASNSRWRSKSPNMQYIISQVHPSLIYFDYNIKEVINNLNIVLYFEFIFNSSRAVGEILC